MGLTLTFEKHSSQFHKIKTEARAVVGIGWLEEIQLREPVARSDKIYHALYSICWRGVSSIFTVPTGI